MSDYTDQAWRNVDAQLAAKDREIERLTGTLAEERSCRAIEVDLNNDQLIEAERVIGLRNFENAALREALTAVDVMHGKLFIAGAGVIATIDTWKDYRDAALSASPAPDPADWKLDPAYRWGRAANPAPDASPSRVPTGVYQISAGQPAPDPAEAAVDAGLAIWPTAESYDERVAVKEILAAATPHLRKDWLERFMQDDSGLPSRFAPHAPDPAEAMRAKTIDECLAIVREVGEVASKGRSAHWKKGEEEWRYAAAEDAAGEIEEAIAALKGNGEGR